MGVGGDYRAPQQGAHVCQPDHGGVCVGPSPWGQNVSTPILMSYPWNQMFISMVIVADALPCVTPGCLKLSQNKTVSTFVR